MVRIWTGARSYAAAGVLGALVGGVAVRVLTRAIPSILSGTMATMMGNMMSAGDSDFDTPAAFCRQMMEAFSKTDSEVGELDA